MEGLTRLVTESLARHGFDRPLDYRRLHWSRWFRCESHHSFLQVPSKPGVFALAEEIMNLAPGNTHVGTAAPGCPAEQSSAAAAIYSRLRETTSREGHPPAKRMLAVTQFFEDDDMAFVLDRMLSTQNPMRARLISGHYFVRFVVIDDQSQRRSICTALNQWIATSAEKATGIGADFATSLELTPATEHIADENQRNLFTQDAVPTIDDCVARALLPATADITPSAAVSATAHVARALLSDSAESPITPVVSTSAADTTFRKPSPNPTTAPQLDSGAATNIHCPTPFPSGF